MQVWRGAHAEKTCSDKNGDLIEHATLQQLSSPDIAWYWIDFHAPTEKEAALLKEYFHFHPLAIEDCFHYLQRPKLDFYEGYLFFVLHALNQKRFVLRKSICLLVKTIS